MLRRRLDRADITSQICEDPSVLSHGREEGLLERLEELGQMFLGGKPPKRLLLEVAEGKYMLLLKTGFCGISGTP